MTILIAGTVDVDPARREAALAEARELVEGALGQPGCRAYAWTADPHDPARIRIFEEWDTAEALATHLDGPWYRRMREHIGASGIRDSSVRKYRVDRIGAVYDGEGRARADFFDATEAG